MRKTLVAAVALAPLCLALGETAARAQPDVTTALTTPIATATADNGAPGDITIESSGSVTVTGAAAAVTLNSSNSISNAGSITTKDADNSTGILIYGGNTAANGVGNSGTIGLTESYNATDSVNGDGIVEAPFAQGTGRYGIRVVGDSPFVGSMANSGTIGVKGNNSFGISIEAPVQGSIGQSGSLQLVGDNGAAFNTSAPVSGPIIIEGAVSAVGQNSQAINIASDVGTTTAPAPLSIYGTITATGYSTATRPSDLNQLTKVQSTAADVEQGGSALAIGGDITGGVFIGAPPVGSGAASATADLDGDGIADALEGTGTVASYGSAPAVLIGASGKDIAIGEYSATPDGETSALSASILQPANAYGLIVRGSISAAGVYDGVSGTGVQIGAPTNSDGSPSGAVDLQGGIRVVGSINASAYDANATAIHLLAGSTVPEIRNEGFIDSTIYQSVASTAATSGLVTNGSLAAGILIEPGASVSTINNYGTIAAAAGLSSYRAGAIIDRSGSITSVLNEGIISSVVTPASFAGSTTALDLSANTTGITLLQQVNPNPIPIDVDVTTTAAGTTTTTAVVTGTTAGATTTTNTVSTTSTTTTTTAGVTTTTVSTTPTSPQIVGDVLLGNGNNTVQLLGGSMSGALSLGGGTDSLTVDNGAVYYGGLSYTGSSLSLNVNNGVLDNTKASTLQLSNLNIGAKGVVYFAVDPANGASSRFQVTGPATLADGAQIGVTLLSPLIQTTTYTVISAATLNDASSDSLLLADTPYFLTGYATSDPAAGLIDITLSLKTPAEMGLNPGQAAAFNAVYTSLPNDSFIEQSVFGQYTRTGFLNVYNQLLPEYSGGLYQLALAGTDAISRATSRTNEIENPSGTRGAWAEEIFYGVDRPDQNAAAYRGGGFGFVGGLETGGAGLGAFGITAAFLAGSISDPHAPGDNLSSLSEIEGGFYWQAEAGGFRADARLGGGYVRLTERREILLTDSTGAISLERKANGSSNGFSATGHFGVGYQFNLGGRFYLRPQARAQYFRLQEGAYAERNGGDGFDLNVASRTGDQADAAASLVGGMTFGSRFRWRPEIEVGYRDVFTGTAGDTTASFYGGQPFTMPAMPITGGGPLARFSMKGDTDFYEVNLEAGAEERNHLTEGDVRLNIRVLF